MTDCLIIGYNDLDFNKYVKMTGAMGTTSGAYRDLDLAFFEYNGTAYRSMDILNHFHFQGEARDRKRFHNLDFLWPVVTYLSTYLSRRGFTFDYINLFHLEKDKLKEKLENEDILTVAITTTLYVALQPLLEVISYVKACNQNVKIIVGGPYISNQSKILKGADLEFFFDYIGADFFVVSSEGEFALSELIGAIKNNSNTNNINNLIYKEGSEYVRTPTSVEVNPLEENMVDYSLFSPDEIGEFVTLRTAKSCPFSCSFCAFPQRAGKYTYLSLDDVEKELNAIREFDQVTTLTIIDDTFNVPKKRFKDILRMMIKNNYGFKWNSFYRCDHGDEEAIELMAEAGCEGVFLGVESFSDKMLKVMNKTARQEDYCKYIPMLQSVGISTHTNLIIGFPEETDETIRETVDVLEYTKPDFFRAQLWYADPTTPIWEKREEYSIQGSSFKWSHNTMDMESACDWVDKLFLNVQNSIWMPQAGFEQWSTFYLQRKGMSMEQIKTFIKNFNAIICDKLKHPGKTDIDPDLLASLKASCQF